MIFVVGTLEGSRPPLVTDESFEDWRELLEAAGAMKIRDPFKTQLEVG